MPHVSQSRFSPSFGIDQSDRSVCFFVWVCDLPAPRVSVPGFGLVWFGFVWFEFACVFEFVSLVHNVSST